MSNTVTCEIHIAKQHHDKIIRRDENGNMIVDFEIMKPIPDSLKINSTSDDERDLYMFITNKDREPFQSGYGLDQSSAFFPLARDRAKELLLSHNQTEIDASYNRGKQLQDNWRIYGAMTDREWAIKNWGCKWNAGTKRVSDNTIVFTTPNSVPQAWLKMFADMHIDFTVKWKDDGGPQGEIICQNGNMKNIPLKR